MQKIYKEIKDSLLSEWQKGLTQRQIAERAGLTDAYINQLFSGKSKVEAMKLETLFKLFPNAQINLQGAQIAGDNALQIQMAAEDNSFERNAEKVLNDDSLSAEEKVKFLKVLKK